MRRRKFIAIVGSAVAWPLTARSQQRDRSTIGLLCSATPDGYGAIVAQILRGLAETGYIEGKNLAVEYRWANEQYDRLPEHAIDLVRRGVDAIITVGGNVPVQAAKAATTTIPIVFAVGGDPVEAGLVPKLSGSGSNVTGVTFFNTNLMPKRLELIREAVPKAATFAILMNSRNPRFEFDKAEIRKAAATAGVEILAVFAAGDADPESAFNEIVQKRVDAVLLHPDAALYNRVRRIIESAAAHRVPTIYNGREVVQIGGLMSYGPELGRVLWQAGVYVGRILKGDKPSDLPIQQPTKFELAINLKTANALGLVVPATLIARADEVIE